MPTRLLLERPTSSTLDRLQTACFLIALVPVAYGSLWAVSLMTWSSGPSVRDMLWLAAPCMLFAAVFVVMAFVRGSVEVHADAVVIHHRPILGRSLRIPRERVAAVLIDAGWAGSSARFPTGNPAAPFLWSEPPTWSNWRFGPRDRGRPLLGDGVVPNIALRLDPPLVLREAREAVVAVAGVDVPSPPSRRVPAEVVFLTLDDTLAARAAFATWPLADAAELPVLPAAVREPVHPPPEMVTVFVANAVGAALLAATGLLWLTPLLIVASVPLLARSVRTLRRRATDAVASAGDDPVAQAAVRANWGDAAVERAQRSIPPPRA